MSAYAKLSLLTFFYFCKLYFPLTYNFEIGTEGSAGGSDSHLTGYLFLKLRKSICSNELLQRRMN